MTPRGMYDMTGRTLVDCEESDRVRGDHKVTPASSLTDPSGNYSSGIVFTEWWADDAPLLRDYRFSNENRPCEHYLATDATAAIEDDA